MDAQVQESTIGKPYTIALLVAAGKSERLRAELPKPYLSLGHETVLRRTVKAFLAHSRIDGVRVVIRREDHGHYKQAVEGLTLFPCVIGGQSRQESVRLGLESLLHRPPRYVLVHDIARPLVSAALISRVIDGLESQAAVIPGLPVTDTLKRAEGGQIGQTVNREQLYAAQTPQGFHFEALLTAHRRFAGEALTDDATLLEKAGVAVALVEGDPNNSKITTHRDLTRMETLLTLHTETRTGLGYDVHRLMPHDADTPAMQQNITLCGVKIPFAYYLEGNSDADVGLHALVDAILGAIGDGDIGMHFPPDDPKWQGADSQRFLLHAYERVSARGGALVHLDVTLICERPRIAPYREQMIHHIAQLLKLSPDRISVKATTTEKLGFTGRSEGIAAQAVATVRVPPVSGAGDALFHLN